MRLAGRHRLPKISACLEWWSQWFGRAESVVEAAGRTQ